MQTEIFDYNLPEELIAQHPTAKRDESMLLVIDRETGALSHEHFYNIIDHLRPTDLLVVNNSKVIHARLIGSKVSTGAKIELFLIKDIGENQWEVLAKPLKRLHIGDEIAFGARATDVDKIDRDNAWLIATLVRKTDEGSCIVRFDYDGIFMEVLERLGDLPLPPYIHRDADDFDENRYQTVYSKRPGSVAAPTAGLHFTEELLDKITKNGIQIAQVTLHVGLGTFRPVKVDNILEHKMHSEQYYISEETARLINETKADGGRIVCVGTTSVRTLESAAVQTPDGFRVKSGARDTDIFIYPGYEWKMVDALITNFHLPKSTLLMLVSSFYDREKMLAAYQEAIDHKYRFFSYGDAMFIQ
ncbi:MAG: tRNA preQ1(34) S-adenosylmethionine ribosyltransferase-isomerase QueA [Clostridiales Family XIII bacterium]|jgi:S-adenosylmethionine:tRNA ribosyltransferase-isomerase|nr:tRNA preQ1(34) S-adenosylmethionine ribosyltransferase-isomerase QueA [Clostridiales Family XIII bacterium]